MSPSRPDRDSTEIPHVERDLYLGLDDPDWPLAGCPLGEADDDQGLGPAWKRREGCLVRTNNMAGAELWEALVRFPNAPVYGLHRRPARQPSIGKRSNFHTMRVLGRVEDLSDGRRFPVKERIADVYLLHNGLNETADFDLHYQLAGEILKGSSTPSVCVIRPFPAHLTRFPYNDMFAEKPLDNFLLDSGDLFRQFIRYMLETRWLLSVLVPRKEYAVITGGKLVRCENHADPEKLATAIVGEWELMDEASPEDLRRAREENEENDVTVTAVTRSVEALRRDLLHWRSHPDERLPDTSDKEKPAIHLVGYSLGSFVAQSVFFAWPYAVSADVTLFGGGELRRLAPTAFAQPEEWQSVLHSLRYEMDRALGGPLVPEAANGYRVQGIERETFEYLRRVFYEVFVQYYGGSYRTRLTEFIQRMLFVTGGQDPIARPGNVLDAAPSEGVNLLNIAGMTHFPTKASEGIQRDQRVFWLRQLGRLLPEFAKQADELRRAELGRSWLNAEKTALHPDAEKAYAAYRVQLDKLPEPRQSLGSSSVPLSDRWFGKEISRICDVIEAGNDGWVLVSRNEVPPVFLGEETVKRYAAALHHSEDLAADEFWLASKRREVLLGRQERTTLLTDIGLEGVVAREDEREKSPPPLFLSRSETPGVARLTSSQMEEERIRFDRDWLETEAVRVLSVGDFQLKQLGEIGTLVAQMQGLHHSDPETLINIRFLPDAWIGIGEDLLKAIIAAAGAEHEDPREQAEAAIASWGARLAAERLEGGGESGRRWRRRSPNERFRSSSFRAPD